MGHKENIYQRYLDLFRWHKENIYQRYLELFRWDIHKGNTYQRYLELFNIGHALRKYLSNLYGQNICYVSGGSIVHC